MRRRKQKSVWQQILQVLLFLILIALFLLASQGLQYVIAWGLAGVTIAGLTWFLIWLIDKQKRHRSLRRIMAIRDIRTIDPFEFELRVGEVMSQHGFQIEVRGGQSDNGIDLVLHKNGFSTAVQVKRYAGHNQIGEPMVRDFFGSFAGAHNKGLFVTTSSYTRQAREWASSRPIELVDWQGWIALEEKVGYSH